MLAGIPLVRSPHFFDAVQWEAAGGYRTVWEGLRPEYRARIRSISGWTAHFFGLPTTEWLATGSIDADVPAPTLESTKMSKIVLDKIAYEAHPVSVERKRELNAKGYKVMDIAFAPKGAKIGGPTEKEAKQADQTGDDAAKAELAEARADYVAKLGKKPFGGWDAKTLREKIAAA
ncbi:MAG: hypothetical protein ACTHKQ_24900 [Mesorhizobium sp.]